MATENQGSREEPLSRELGIGSPLENMPRTKGASRSQLGILDGAPVRMSWGAIIGGAIVALGLWTLLYTFGLAVGLSSVDPNNPGSVKASGIFTGIWGLLSPLVALFVGGMVASRGAGIVTRLGGAMHGLVMWGLTTLVGAWILSNLIGNLASGVASAGRTAVEAGAGAMSGVAGQMGNLAQTFGLDADDALRPLNQRLQAEGKPTITAEQLQGAASNVIRDGLREGRVDRGLLVNSIAQGTALSREDAEQVAMRVEDQFAAAKARLDQNLAGAKESLQKGTLKAADVTGKAFWGVFGTLFLGMLSAVFGATAGVSKRQRTWAGEQPVSPPRSSPPLHTGREAYP